MMRLRLRMLTNYGTCEDWRDFSHAFAWGARRIHHNEYSARGADQQIVAVSCDDQQSSTPASTSKVNSALLKSGEWNPIACLTI